jgi:hypothetical protein
MYGHMGLGVWGYPEEKQKRKWHKVKRKAC